VASALPAVKVVKKDYRSGVTIKKQAMLAIEEKLERKKGLEPWSIRIAPQAQMGKIFFHGP
jgi:hypothetical protein